MNLSVCVSIFIFCMIWPSILLFILGLWEGPNQILFLAFGICLTLFFLVFFSQIWRCVDFEEKREELGKNGCTRSFCFGEKDSISVRTCGDMKNFCPLLLEIFSCKKYERVTFRSNPSAIRF